nr:hypothetical protein [Tanacetum cinerariifolium]
MKESKAYKTYLGYAIGVVPPKVARKSKKDIVSVPADEEPIQKEKRVKRSAKKSLTTLTIGIVIREPPVETQSKRKEKKSSDEKITPPVTSDGTGDKPGVLDVTKDESTESESESWGNDDDDSNDEEGSERENDSEEHESDSEQDADGNDDDEVKDDDDDEDDDNDDDKFEGDEDRGMNSDDVQDQKEDKTEVHVTSSSRSSDLASKFLNFIDIPSADVEIVSLVDIYVHHEVPRIHTSTLLVVPVSDKDEGPSAGSDQGLKKRKTRKDAEPTTSPKTKGSSSRSSKGTKSQPKSSGKSVHAKEPEFKVEDTDTPQGQEGNQECYKALSKKLDWETLKGGDYPFDLSNPLLLITRGNLQSVPVEYFINNDLKYLQGGILTMTYTTSTTKIKGILHWRDQCKTFYVYARGIQSRGYVYSTKCILAVTHVSIMRKHEYGYLEKIVNQLTNLSGDDVADFTIALKMFTRSLVIQKQLKDLQLGVESYQKQINVTKLDTIRPDLRKRHPLLSSLKDITKNIDMEYLPKRRWSTLEKKRAHCMIKDINKLLKEKRMMRSLEKFGFAALLAVLVIGASQSRQHGRSES